MKYLDGNMSNIMLEEMAKKRKILLVGNIDDNSALNAIYWLKMLESIDIKRNKKKPITLIINSPGGGVEAGFMLIHQIKSMRRRGWEINAEILGNACSMAFVIALSCEKRTCGNYSRLMIHPISYGAFGDHRSHLDKLEEAEGMWSNIKQIILEDCLITEEQLETLLKERRDWFIKPTEALDLGIVHSII